VSGVYVAPLEIQKCLEGHEAVRECVVLGVKDADGLTKTKAFIVLNDGLKVFGHIKRKLAQMAANDGTTGQKANCITIRF
jgi:benzoate-CoA ligase